MAKRCYGCMQLKENSPVCEHCGFNENVQNESHQLPMGTVLRGQYMVGKCLGQGGVRAGQCVDLFTDFTSLKTINFGTAFHVEGVKYVGEMFDGCSIEETDMSNFTP